VAPMVLSKFTLPYSDRNLALADLEAMTITGTSLMRDLDGAAATVVQWAGLPRRLT
jgi:hypothetical protein